jgi:hypothetical protein
MDKTEKYLNIPIPMLADLHLNSKKFFDNVFDVGIYTYSKNLTGSEEKKYKASLEFLGITQGSVKSAIDNAKSILRRMPAKYPTTGIEKGMLFDYYKNEKTEFEIMCLSAFLAIKSILGTKPYCKTNKALIHARMFGYSSVKDIPAKLTPLQLRYQIRWHMDKVLTSLQTDWFVKIISSHHRGMYLSIDLELNELVSKIAANKQSVKIQQLRENKKKAIESAKAQLTAH